MSIIADAIQPLIPSAILNASGKLEKTTASDAIILGKAGYSVSLNTDGSIELDFRASEQLSYALCCDVSRFASAAFQSLGGFSERECDKLSLPWDLIKLYYAAFYAAHGILRFCGQSCFYLNDAHTQRLNNYLAATAQASNVAGGLYHGRLSANSTQIRLSKVGGRFGGSHEDFWKVFAAFVQSLRNAALGSPLSPIDAQLVFTKLDEIVNILRQRGTFGRLSSIRNELQYRHGYEGWLPSAMPKSHLGELVRLGCQWRSDPMNIRLSSGRLGDLGEFTAASAFLVGACRSLAERVCERSAAGRRSFLQYATMRTLG